MFASSKIERGRGGNCTRTVAAVSLVHWCMCIYVLVYVYLSTAAICRERKHSPDQSHNFGYSLVTQSIFWGANSRLITTARRHVSVDWTDSFAFGWTATGIFLSYYYPVRMYPNRFRRTPFSWEKLSRPFNPIFLCRVLTDYHSEQSDAPSAGFGVPWQCVTSIYSPKNTSQNPMYLDFPS